jgi:hypothetical protein
LRIVDGEGFKREQFKLINVDFEGRIVVVNDNGEQLKFHHGQAFIDLYISIIEKFNINLIVIFYHFPFKLATNFIPSHKYKFKIHGSQRIFIF